MPSTIQCGACGELWDPEVPGCVAIADYLPLTDTIRLHSCPACPEPPGPTPEAEPDQLRAFIRDNAQKLEKALVMLNNVLNADFLKDSDHSDIKNAQDLIEEVYRSETPASLQAT